jgi:glutathione synthase/RimK-type ligase-like ATP-grasp enzyme
VRLADINAVYYRRPSAPRLCEAMSQAEQQWAADETRHALGGVLSALRAARWFNHPRHNAAATKPVQLAEAAAVGLAVPRTLITTRPADAREFIASCRRGAVYKTLSGSPRVGRGIYTTLVEAADVDTLSGVAATAHLFQERLTKQFEVRLTVIGSRMFAARIDVNPDSTAGTIDYRADYAHLTYTRIPTPRPVRAGVTALLRRLHLRFAAIDFIVTPSDTWHLIDVNPNGQWGWIQQATGYPIAHTIATHLAQGAAR